MNAVESQQDVLDAKSIPSPPPDKKPQELNPKSPPAQNVADLPLTESGSPPDDTAQNPRGFPQELLDAISGPQELGSRVQAVLDFVRNLEAANDVAHWKRGAAVELIYEEKLAAQKKHETDEFLKKELGAACSTAIADRRVFRQYRGNRTQYLRHGHSLAKRLCRKDFTVSLRDELFDKARGEKNRPTVEELVAAIARHDKDHPKPGKSTRKKPESVPLKDGQEVILGPDSTVVLEDGYLKLDLNLADLDTASRKSLDGLLKRMADGAYCLPTADAAATDPNLSKGE